MKTIWTRYLEPISVEEAERKPFLQQLQKFEEHSHFHMQELPVTGMMEEPYKTVSGISQDTTEESISPEMPDGRVEVVETVEVVDNSAEEIEFTPELTPELASELTPELASELTPELAPELTPELAPESSLEMQILEVEDEMSPSLELEVPAMAEAVPVAIEVVPSELLDEVTEVVPEDIVAVEYTGEGTEVMRWVSKSHKGYDMRLNTYPDDVVRLIEYDAGELILKYSISGEDIEDTHVVSIEEAEDIIIEDNEMTGEIYGDVTELKWVKVTKSE